MIGHFNNVLITFLGLECGSSLAEYGGSEGFKGLERHEGE